MEQYKRQMIYISEYKDSMRCGRAGYVGLYVRGNSCTVQIYFRKDTAEREENSAWRIHPVYVFEDGFSLNGGELTISEGMAVDTLETGTMDFLGSGRGVYLLEAIYIEGIPEYVYGGRVDGQEITQQRQYTVTDWMDTVTQVVEEKSAELIPEVLEQLTETWSLEECMEKLPELRLPFDGRRRKSCRMNLKDLERLPEQWKCLMSNNFLLHGFYEYHHLMLAKVSTGKGERYVLGVPGEYSSRSRYMAECFGFLEFWPLEQWRGKFGYWYYYLQ